MLLSWCDEEITLLQNFVVRHPCCVGSITKNFFFCITHTVEHNYISPSSTVYL